MELAIRILQQRLYDFTTSLRTSAQPLEMLATIEETLNSLKELYQTKVDMELAKEALAAAEQRLSEVSNMGTIAGSKGHAIVSAVMARREDVRHDVASVRSGDIENLRSEKLLRELVEILGAPPAAITQPAVGAPAPHNAPPAAITQPVTAAGDVDRPEEIRKALEDHLGNGERRGMSGIAEPPTRKRTPRTDGHQLDRQN